MNKMGCVAVFARCRHSFRISAFSFFNSVARLRTTVELLRVRASVPTESITARTVVVQVHNGWDYCARGYSTFGHRTYTEIRIADAAARHVPSREGSLF